MKKIFLFTILLSTILFPQLKELEVKPTENRGQIPIFRDYPDKAAMIFYTQFDNLSFYSSYGIVDTKGDRPGGKYILIIEPTRQSIEVRCAGFKTEIIKLGDLQPREVLYYEVLPKKEEGISAVTEIGITIQVSPSDAKILLDGQPFTNNVTTKVTLGKHNLRIEKPGYGAAIQEINVTPEKTFFAINLEKVSLSPVTIRSNPSNASVYVNNELKGTTEVAFFLYSGSYDLRIELPDYLPVNETIQVAPTIDKTKNLFSYELVKDKGTLQLSITPADAIVTVNKIRVNNGKNELGPGKYLLEAKANKYETFAEEIEIRRGEVLTKSITLASNTGLLVLDVYPPGAEITLNKEKRTGSKIELVPGVYDMEVSAPTYYPETTTFEILKGSTVNKSFRLKQKRGVLQFTVKPVDAKASLGQNGIEIYNWEGINLIDTIAEGTYDLTVKANNHKTLREKITIKVNESTVENIQLIPGSDLVIPAGMVWVEGGTFMMGSNDGKEDEKPIHTVTVSSFMIGRTEVTQELWQRVMGNKPSRFIGNRLPVESISWYEAVEFCNKLSEKEGLQKAYSGSGSSINCDFTASGYRLPTEAEWEYAARGGASSTNTLYSGSNNIKDVTWYGDNSGSTTHEAGTKSPNQLGIYDMSGNVWEWCWDWKGEYSSSIQTNPKGPNSGSSRVLRGGSWYVSAVLCRVAYRYSFSPDDWSRNRGFRLARSK